MSFAIESPFHQLGDTISCPMKNHAGRIAETVSPIVLDNLVALVRLGEYFTHDDIAALIKQRSKGKPVKETYIRRYIEWGIKLALFKKEDDAFLRLPKGEELAAQKDNTPEIKSLLHALLLRDPVYRRFTELLDQYPRFEQFSTIMHAGGWIGRSGQKDNYTTPKVLKRWAKELGIIVELALSHRFIVIDRAIQMNDEEFWHNLLVVYEYERSVEPNSIFGVRIPVLRDELCYRWRMHPDYFDLRLRDLFISKEYARRMQLSGGPARYLRELRRTGLVPLTIGSKQYMYIEISRN